MRVVVDSAIRFRAAAAPPAFVAHIRNGLTWANPRRAQLERLGKWVGGEPEAITAFHEDRGVVRLPRGVLPDFLRDARRFGTFVHLDDRRLLLDEVEFGHTSKLRDYQCEAVDAALGPINSRLAFSGTDCGQGCLVMPCGGGKTRTAAAIIALLSQPTLVLVHTRDLAEQWCAVAEEVLGLPEKGIGRLGAGRARAGDGRLVVATVQSLAKMDGPMFRDFGKRFGCVVIDEAHHTPADTWDATVGALPARYRFGLTATPEREDGLEDLLYTTVGPILYRIGYGELLAAGHLVRPEIRVVRTAFQYLYDKRDEDKRGEERRDYQTMATALVDDPRRTELVVGIAERDARDGHCVLVLSGRVQHCFNVADALGARGVRAAALTGNLPDGRAFPAATRRQVLKDFREGRLDVVCASTLADEGLDVPRIDRLVLAFPAKAAGRITQRIGRAMRRSDETGKTDAVVYDLVDPHVTYLVDDGRRPVALLMNQHRKRMRLYRALLEECGVDQRQSVLELGEAA